MKSDEIIVAYLLKRYDLKEVKNFLLSNNMIKVFDAQSFLLDDDTKNIITYNRSLRKHNYYVIKEIRDAFLINNIKHMFFKGLLLSQYLYNDPFSRISADVDLYVYKEDFHKAYEILKDNGFLLINEKYLDSEHHISMAKDNLLLELHHNILNPFTKINEAFLLNRHKLIDLEGEKFSTFDITATITHLIYHLYMHTWLHARFYDLLTKKGIKPNRFLYYAYEIALFAEKYFDKINWNEIINDIKNQNLRIIFKKMIYDILEIFPEAFPEAFIDTINDLNYVDDERDIFYKHLTNFNISEENIGGVLSDFIDTQWNENQEKNIQIKNNGNFILDKAIIKDDKIAKNHQLSCEGNIERNCDDLILEFKVTNDDFCFSDIGNYDTQASDGVHLIICGTEKYSYNSIFLFPKKIEDKIIVVPVDVLNNVNREIDENFISATCNTSETEYTITATLKKEFLKKFSMEKYFYLGLVISDCSSKTQKRKSELILSNPHSEWYNPIYFAKIELE